MGLKGYFWGLEYIVYIGSAEKLIPSTRDQFDRKASRSLPSTRDRGRSLEIYFTSSNLRFKISNRSRISPSVPMDRVGV